MNEIKILIVEDEVFPDGYVIKSILEREGYFVLGIAGTLEEAIGLSLENEPDIIIMDISLNGDHSAGIKAAKEILEDITSQIIYLTGLERSEELIKKAEDTKPFAILKKPFLDDQLLTTVMRASLRIAEIKNKPKEKNILIIADTIEDIIDVKEFEKNISIFNHQIWHFGKITVGKNKDIEIIENTKKSDIAILLVSTNYAISEDCKKMREMVFSQNHTQVIPILITPCVWEIMPFYKDHKIAPLPRNQKPISHDSWNSRASAYKSIMMELKDILI